MKKKRLPKRSEEICILLHNIRSAHNVGAIFRTADALGVRQIFLSGYTPLPLDRFLRPVKEIAKTAIGAEKTIPWTAIMDPKKTISELRGFGYHIVGVEQDTHAIDYRLYHIGPKTLFLVGNEVLGLSASLRKHCDTLLEIPMRGKKESLNVGVALGVTLFRVCDP